MGNSLCCINDLKNNKSNIDIYAYPSQEKYDEYDNWTLETWIDKYKNGNTIRVAFPKVIGIRLISTLKAIAFAMDSPGEERMFYEFIKKHCLTA